MLDIAKRALETTGQISDMQLLLACQAERGDLIIQGREFQDVRDQAGARDGASRHGGVSHLLFQTLIAKPEPIAHLAQDLSRIVLTLGVMGS